VPFKKLVVELGGLCMLVIRKNVQNGERKGLYVLMPDAHHGTEVHCPLFVAEAQHSVSDDIEFKRLKLEEKADEIDLTFMADHAVNSAALPTFVANVSKFYKQPRYVDSACYEGDKHHGLAARIVLPLPEKIKMLPDASPAVFFVPGSTTGSFQKVGLAGQCCIEYTVHADIDSKWNGQIKGKGLRPDGSDTIRMHFVNARPKDYLGGRYQHFEGEPWNHPQAYHDLLLAASSLTGPRAIIGEDSSGQIDKAKKEDCGDIKIPNWPPIRKGKVEIEFIDPFTCTLGGGCPSENDC
jgi:hypothetical protein